MSPRSVRRCPLCRALLSLWSLSHRYGRLQSRVLLRLLDAAKVVDDDAVVAYDRQIFNYQVDLLLGKAYADWGHISDAVTVYDKLITEHPEDFRGYLSKGILLKENSKTGDAERMFIQAKFFAPEEAKALVDRYARR